MPRSKNAEHRFLILDRCFSDFHRKYSIDDLLEEVNEKLYDANGCQSTIKIFLQHFIYCTTSHWIKKFLME